jgi:hypothetical protein
MLDISHDAHDIILHKADAENIDSGGNSNIWKFVYIIFSISFLTCGIYGLTELFDSTDGYTNCSTGSAFVIIGLIISITQLFISALNSVNRGILTPCIMFAYATFMTWYALLSSPDKECNPNAMITVTSSSAKKASIGIIIGLSLFLILFCIVAGTKIMQIFNIDGQGVLETAYGGYGSNGETELTDSINPDDPSSSNPTAPKMASIGYTDRDGNGNDDDRVALSDDGKNESTGTPKEVMFFHVLMALASSYSAMVLSSWGKTNGAPEGASGNYSFVGAESMWLKIISTWIFYLMYYKALHLAYQMQSE